MGKWGNGRMGEWEKGEMRKCKMRERIKKKHTQVCNSEGGICAKRITHAPKARYTPAQAGYTTPEAKRPEGTPPKSLIILRLLVTLLSLFLFSCFRCGLLDLFLLVLSFSHDIVVLKFLTQMTTIYSKFPNEKVHANAPE